MEKSTVKEDDTYVIHGPPCFTPIPTHTLGEDIYQKLLNSPGNSVAMIDAFTHEKLLHSKLLQQTINLAEALRLHNYQGQDTVFSICSENCLQFFIPVFASLFNGAIMAPVNHIYTEYELEHTLEISAPKVVFCSEAVAQKFVNLMSKIRSIERIIILGSKVINLDIVDSMDLFISKSLKGRNVDITRFQPARGDSSKMAAFILCSSGTTGLPKGVLLSHLNLIVRQIHSRDPIYFSGQNNTKILGLMPFFHGYGLNVGISSLINYETIICMKQFDENVFLKSIQDYRIETLALAPPLAIFLAKTDKIHKYDLSSITNAFCGAAPLSKSIEEEVTKRLKLKIMRQAYGLTESTLAVIFMSMNDYRPGSCGKVMQHMSLKIRDPETGRSLGPNKVGEICIKGPLVMMGYYKNEQATKDTFTSDGWLKSGDLGYYDEEGYFYIIDRLKELIKYKGFQVAPAELEAILLNHPKISDAGVVGLPDELVGERPLAFVVKKGDVQLTEQEVQKYVAKLVSPQKRLSGGVIFVKMIPKNSSGKILRKELKKLLNNYSKKMIESKL